MAAFERTFVTTKEVKYAYTYDLPQPGSPTILFLHGFPSNKADWLHQRDHFCQLGYGVISIDLLGFGHSDAPDNEKHYHLRCMSSDIVELLDHAQVQGSVIGIGHDLGAMLLSRLAAFHADRIEAMVYLAVGPHQLGQRFDVDAINKFTKDVLGYEYLGYITWMTTDPQAQAEMERHAESVMKLMFSEDHDLWNVSFRPLGAMREFVTGNEDAPVGGWFNEEMQQRHLDMYKRPGGYKGAVKWYKMMANNGSLSDEEPLAEQSLSQPALLIAPEHELAQQKDTAAAWHTQLTARALASGHWIHLEAATRTNQLIEEFIASL